VYFKQYCRIVYFSILKRESSAYSYLNVLLFKVILLNFLDLFEQVHVISMPTPFTEFSSIADLKGAIFSSGFLF
jgi:hypothetical protein